MSFRAVIGQESTIGFHGSGKSSVLFHLWKKDNSSCWMRDKKQRFDPVYFPTAQEEEFDALLASAKDLVVVAGGLEIIAGLADPVERIVDIGRVIIPRGRGYFLEAMGVGAFADILKRYNIDEGKSVRRAVKTVLETLSGYQPKFFHIHADGQDFSGHYFLCEVMNAPTVGFHHMLAPKAEPDDGFFDLVLFHGDQRENYAKLMTAVLTGTFENLPEVTIQRVRQLEIA